MKRFALGMTSLLLLGLWTSIVDAAPGGAGRGPMDRGPGAAAGGKAEQYAVIQIGEDVKAVPKSRVNEEKKRIADQYKQDKKAYDEAYKAAIKNKEKPDMPKPDKKAYTVKVLKTSMKTEQDANAWIENYLSGEDNKEEKADKTAKKPALK
jgi:ribosomal protein L14E/L6E/L27E